MLESSLAPVLDVAAPVSLDDDAAVSPWPEVIGSGPEVSTPVSRSGLDVDASVLVVLEDESTPLEGASEVPGP